MKYFLLILAAALAVSCSQSHKPKGPNIDSLPKPDTVIVAYGYNGAYNLARAVRSFARAPKITDSSSKKWDWFTDTIYTLEVPVTPLDTLRDSLKKPRFDPSTHLPLLRKAFNTPVHSPLPAYFWPLLPPPDRVLDHAPSDK